MEDLDTIGVRAGIAVVAMGCAMLATAWLGQKLMWDNRKRVYCDRRCALIPKRAATAARHDMH